MCEGEKNDVFVRASSIMHGLADWFVFTVFIYRQIEKYVSVKVQRSVSLFMNE